MKPSFPLSNTATLRVSFCWTAVIRSPNSIAIPPSPERAMTWRPGAAFCRPSAVGMADAMVPVQQAGEEAPLGGGREITVHPDGSRSVISGNEGIIGRPPVDEFGKVDPRNGVVSLRCGLLFLVGDHFAVALDEAIAEM